MNFVIISLFPEMFKGVFDSSMLWKAQELKLCKFEYINLRDFGLGPRKQVDDTPYGGGDGMLLRVEPIFAAVESAKQRYPDAKVVLMTPKGQTWTQSLAKQYANSQKDYIIICPHYEGYDERILALVDHQISVGKFILTGGEIPAMTIVDSIVRLTTNTLNTRGQKNSAA